ncbi:MAG TPA: zf-HC2 domain-containing protein [Burkholderiaceae bacterium]
MNCHEAGTWVEAYADRQLGALRRYAMQGHLRGCAACAAKHQGVLTLRAQLREEAPYFRMPPELHARRRARFAVSRAPSPMRAAPQRDRWLWLGGGALAGCTATILTWLVSAAVIDWRVNQDIATEAVAIHTRAVLSERLIQVASSDQHTVKPWLSAHLDYSPPVQDLATEGFTLTGGRLDTLREQRVATLVYRHRQHVIDVFVEPESARALSGPRSMRGFNVATARGSGMDWLAVSDIAPDVLNAFVQRLAEPRSSAPIPPE